MKKVLLLIATLCFSVSNSQAVEYKPEKIKLARINIKLPVIKIDYSKKRTVAYTGDSIAKGNYVILADTDVFRKSVRYNYNIDDNLRYIKNQKQKNQKEYEERLAKAKAKYDKCLATKKKCKLENVKLNDEIEYATPVADMRVDSIRNALMKHGIEARNQKWVDMINKSREIEDIRNRVSFIDNEIDGMLEYKNRAGVWTLTPDEAIRNGGLCRDYAVLKYFAIMESTNGEYNEENMRIITVLPLKKDGEDQSDVFHVVLAVKINNETYYLDMIKSDIQNKVGLISNKSDNSLLKRGVLWIGNHVFSEHKGIESKIDGIGIKEDDK